MPAPGPRVTFRCATCANTFTISQYAANARLAQSKSGYLFCSGKCGAVNALKKREEKRAAREASVAVDS